MLMLDTVNQWAITAGLALVVCGLFGVLSSVNFPGLVQLKGLRAFPLLRVCYGLITAAVFVIFVIFFVLVSVNMGATPS